MEHAISEKELTHFRAWIQEEFSRKCRIGSKYSVRAFARNLDLDPSTVSQILSGKRRVSRSMQKKIIAKVGKPYLYSELPNTEASLDTSYYFISMDHFAAISDWYHFAILDLTLTKNFKSNISWIAKRLNISSAEALMAIDRLKRLKMLEEVNGKLVKSKAKYSNYKEGQTSGALKEYQRQVIRKALTAIDDCPQELKDITSTTIAGNVKKIKEAKELIKKFRRELAMLMEDGEGTSVYHLAVQLYPVTNDN